MSEEKLILSADVETIPVLEYDQNETITEVVIPEGVKVLRSKAFQRCTNLKTVHLPKSLTNIDLKAFHKAGIQDLYYNGSRYDWNQIEICPTGNGILGSCRIHFAQTDPRDEESYLPGDGDKSLLYSKIHSLLNGGDGKLHIIAPELCVEGVYTKPGDMSLLIFPRGSTMLIDTGHYYNYPKVKEFLTGIGLKQLDYFAFSHTDGDHVSNAQDIADLILSKNGRIGQVLSTGQIYGPFVPNFFAFLQKEGISLDMMVRAGRVYDIDGVKLEILGPTDEDMTMDSNDGACRNNQSMIMKFTYGNASYLCAGDLYEPQEDEVIRRYGEQLKVDIWKCNHHGAYTSNTTRWMDALGGEIAFALSNDNGDTVLAQRMQEHGIRYLTTGCQGTFMISADTDGVYEVETQYHNGLRMFQRVQHWNFDKT